MEERIQVVARAGLSPCLGWTDVYIGRPSILGNPFVLRDESMRSHVIAQYAAWLSQQFQRQGRVYQELCRLRDLLQSGAQLRLVCFCAPRACHGDIIKATLLLMAQGAG